jgi:hypothetical protein
LTIPADERPERDLLRKLISVSNPTINDPLASGGCRKLSIVTEMSMDTFSEAGATARKSVPLPGTGTSAHAHMDGKALSTSSSSFRNSMSAE